MAMKSISLFATLCAGILFGLGMGWSEMVNPARVIGFLDITGAWDPTLAMVMGGALLVTVPLFPRVLKQQKPVCEVDFSLPQSRYLDKKLVLGAVLFGVGWGIAGFCPGPVVAGLVTLSGDVILFAVAMLAGFWIAKKAEPLLSYL